MRKLKSSTRLRLPRLGWVGGHLVHFLPIQLEHGVTSSGSFQAKVFKELKNDAAKAPKRTILDHIWGVPRGRSQLSSGDPIKGYNSGALALTSTLNINPYSRLLQLWDFNVLLEVRWFWLKFFDASDAFRLTIIRTPR